MCPNHSPGEERPWIPPAIAVLYSEWSEQAPLLALLSLRPQFFIVLQHGGTSAAARIKLAEESTLGQGSGQDSKNSQPSLTVFFCFPEVSFISLRNGLWLLAGRDGVWEVLLVLLAKDTFNFLLTHLSRKKKCSGIEQYKIERFRWHGHTFRSWGTKWVLSDKL